MKQIIIVILWILAIILLVSINDFMWRVEAQVKEPEKTYSISGEKMTSEKYQEVKLELKGKVGNRDKVKLTLDDANRWFEVINQNLKTCQLKNVTTDNLVDLLNNTCLK